MPLGTEKVNTFCQRESESYLQSSLHLYNSLSYFVFCVTQLRKTVLNSKIGNFSVRWQAGASCHPPTTIIKAF
jgi:hypothetical protein